LLRIQFLYLNIKNKSWEYNNFTLCGGNAKNIDNYNRTTNFRLSSITK
jgi:hypothetical protein